MPCRRTRPSLEIGGWTNSWTMSGLWLVMTALWMQQDSSWVVSFPSGVFTEVTWPVLTHSFFGRGKKIKLEVVSLNLKLTCFSPRERI